MRLALIAQELRIGSLVRPATSLHCEEVNQCDGGLRLLQGPRAASSGRTGHFIFVRPIRDGISLPSSSFHVFITDAPLLGCTCRDPFRMQHTWDIVACGESAVMCQLLLRAPTQAWSRCRCPKLKCDIALAASPLHCACMNAREEISCNCRRRRDAAPSYSSARGCCRDIEEQKPFSWQVMCHCGTATRSYRDTRANN